MGDMGDYWRDVKPFLKEQAQEKRADNFDSRLQYAIDTFEREHITYRLCNQSIGHFNLYDDDKNMILCFWSYTGKCYIPSENYSENIGIRNCIKKYRKIIEKRKNNELQ